MRKRALLAALVLLGLLFFNKPAPAIAQDPEPPFDWQWPANGSVTGEYYEPYAQYGSEPNHTGIDIGLLVGSDVHASGRGIVILVQENWMGYKGWAVAVEHPVMVSGGTLYSWYFHLFRPAVTVGDQVDVGKVVGYSGCAGTGCHLHWAASNKAPSEFGGYYEHASEMPDGRGWIDPRLGFASLAKPVASVSKIQLGGGSAIVGIVLVIVLIFLAVRHPQEAGAFARAAGNTIRAGWHGLGWLKEQALIAYSLLNNLMWGSTTFERKSSGRRILTGVIFGLILTVPILGIALLSVATRIGSSNTSTPVVFIAGVPSVYFPRFPEVTWWNGDVVKFHIPTEVQTAVDVAAARHGCDGDLLVSLAFGESTRYNNLYTSESGAAGVWQFMPATWAMYWPDEANRPIRNDIPAAADAACRMILALELAKQTNESLFVNRFTGADGGAMWNAHEGQARFIWRLWQTLKKGGDAIEN